MGAHICGTEPPDREDDLAKQSVLAILLDAYPARRSTEEVVRELADSADDFGERDLTTTRSATRWGQACCIATARFSSPPARLCAATSYGRKRMSDPAPAARVLASATAHT